MPSFPEVADTCGEVGLVEVQHQLEPQEFRGPAGNVAVSGKIIVYLYGEEEQCHEQFHRGIVMGEGEDMVDDTAAGIADQDFFEHSD